MQVRVLGLVVASLAAACFSETTPESQFRHGHHEEEFDTSIPEVPQWLCTEGETHVQIVSRDWRQCGPQTGFQEQAHNVPREEHYVCACEEWHLVWAQFLWNPAGSGYELTGEQCACSDEPDDSTAGGPDPFIECGAYVLPPAVTPPDCQGETTASPITSGGYDESTSGWQAETSDGTSGSTGGSGSTGTTGKEEAG